MISLGIAILAVFCVAGVHELLEFLMKVIDVAISDAGGDLIYLHIGIIKKIYGMIDPYFIKICIEVETGFCGELFSEI